MKIIKSFALALCLALLAINTAQAVVPAGVAVTAKASGMIAGGSNVSLTWTAPAAASYKVWLNVPKGSKATNALYRVYPKGNLVGNTLCSPTDATYPCFEIPVNQALNQSKWIQLTANTTTQWTFAKTGYVVVNPVGLATTELLGVAAIRFEKVTTTTALAIGQTYQGGIIFYLDGTGQHGLIAAPTDIKDAYGNSLLLGWGMATGTTGTTVGTGKTNTAAIIASQGAGIYAASMCDDLVVGIYQDWYLPSKDELNLMYTNIGQGAVAPLVKNTGGFLDSTYWSSSAYDYANAWGQPFTNGHQYNYDKSGGTLYVRAIRAF